MPTIPFSQQGDSSIPATHYTPRRHRNIGDPVPGTASFVYFCPDCLAWQVDVLEPILRNDDILDALHDAFAAHECVDPVWIFRYVRWTQ